MSNLSILFIALALSMDAFAVSITSGIAIKKLHVRHALLIATFFGAFQAIMPVFGWLGGNTFRSAIEAVDHWVAFGLLALVGIKMIWEAVTIEEKEYEDTLRIRILFILAIATSIDAFAIGITLSVVGVSIMNPVIVIGLVTFGMSFVGVYIGDMFGHLFEKKIEIAGGLLLIGIGVKIVVEHLF
jgi:putative Mn2+ efflux pump MntP